MNTGDIPDSATASRPDEARSRLKLDRMNKIELDAYYRHLDNIVILRDNIFMARVEGFFLSRNSCLYFINEVFLFLFFFSDYIFFSYVSYLCCDYNV